LTVVGVTGDVRHVGLAIPPRAEIFLAISTSPPTEHRSDCVVAPTMVASSHDIGMVFAPSLSWPPASLRVSATRLERRMTTQTLVKRVDTLEERVTRLEELPARMDSLTLQVSQLRDEMRVEFSAVRDEIRAGDEETRRVLRDEIRTGDEETRRVLGDEIRAGDMQVMNQARVLHEDVVSRLALSQDAGHQRRKRSTKGDPQ
jgi:hypothetical protein